MTDGYYDGVYADARRNYRDSTRSYHIPAAPSRLGFYVRTAVQFAAVAGVLAVIWAVLA